MHILTRHITSKRVRGNNVDFLTIKITSKKYMETMWIFRSSKLHPKTYGEITQIFLPARLRQKRYVEKTRIFRSSKLHRKSKRKWRGKSSKFGIRRIDIMSTSNRRGFDVVCSLGRTSFWLSYGTCRNLNWCILTSPWSITFSLLIN